MVVLQSVLIRMNINLSTYLALHYWMSPDFKWWQFFSYMFMHGSPEPQAIGMTIAHIFFNMYGLFMFGSILENMWGPKRFLTFYIICGLGAGLCHLGVMGLEFASFNNAFAHYQEHPTLSAFSEILRKNHLSAESELIRQWSMDPNCNGCAEASVKAIYNYATGDMLRGSVVGASGSLFGVLFAFGYLFPNTELYIMFIPVPIKAKWAVAGYAAIELFSGVGKFQGDNVAHFAHLGGMLFGFIILMIWKRNRNKFY